MKIINYIGMLLELVVMILGCTWYDWKLEINELWI